MKLLFLSTVAFFAGSVLALPPLEPREDRVQVAHLTFHAGPVSYQLDVPADGRPVQTSMSELPLSSPFFSQSISTTQANRKLTQMGNNNRQRPLRQHH